MKKVICVYNGMPKDKKSIRLTIGKIYDVINIVDDDGIITIIDNVGDETTYYLTAFETTWFEDASPYLREDKFNELGI